MLHYSSMQAPLYHSHEVRQIKGLVVVQAVGLSVAGIPAIIYVLLILWIGDTCHLWQILFKQKKNVLHYNMDGF